MLLEIRNNVTYKADGSVDTSYREEYTYNEDEYLLSKGTYYENSSTEIYQYTYDSYGNLLMILRQSNGLETILEKHSYTYNVNGNMLEDYVSYSDSQELWLNAKRTYGDDNNVISVTSYNTDGSVAYSTTFGYDSDGHLISWTSYDNNGDVSSVNTYSSTGSPLSSISYNTDGSVYSQSNYYYAPKDIALNVWKEPTT